MKITKKILSSGILALAAITLSPQILYAQNNAIIINKTAHYTVNKDNTFVLDSSLKQKLNTRIAVIEGQKVTYTYFPDRQSVSVPKAYAILPNGKKWMYLKIVFSPDHQLRHMTPQVLPIALPKL